MTKRCFNFHFSISSQFSFLHFKANLSILIWRAEPPSVYRPLTWLCTYTWLYICIMNWYLIFLTPLHLSSASIEAFTTTANALAKGVAEILAENLGVSSTFFEENCPEETSYLRMNRYPPCPFSSEVFGLIPHTDSSFLTVLNQDQIGGLQLLKNGRWINVKPNPEALVINIGDLFQVCSV